MKTFPLIISIFLFFATPQVLACSFSGASLFKPTLAPWQSHPGPAQKGQQGAYWEAIPSPIVKVTSIIRGSGSSGHSCSDMGTLSLAISLPKESTYSIEEFGFYFRVKNGRLPDALFPDVPVVGVIEKGQSNIVLAWLDGHPSQQIELDFEVEAFLITNGLNIGPPTVFTVKAGEG